MKKMRGMLHVLLLLPIYIVARAGYFRLAWKMAAWSGRVYFSREHAARCMENARLIKGANLEHFAAGYRSTQLLLLVIRRITVTDAGKDLRKYLEKIIYPHAQINDAAGYVQRIRSTRCMVALTHTGDHFASISMLAYLLADSGLKLIVPITNARQPLQEVIEGLSCITRAPVRCVGADKAGIVALLQAAKDPQCRVAMFFDLSPQTDAIEYDVVEPCSLFGRQAYMASGIWRIAERLGWPLLYAHGSMNEDGYQLHLNHWQEQSGSTAELLALGIQGLERHLAQHPDSWLYLATLERFYNTPVAVRKKLLKAQKLEFQQLLQRWHPAYSKG